MQILNWDLVKNPVNWAMILLMILIAGYVLHLILPVTIQPGGDAAA